MMQREIPQAWWFDSHNMSKQSPWLTTTLFELEDKTKQMLKVIEQDADSFAQRAEMYYKKRPILVNMIGELYRSHRSLAEQYDLLKTGSSTRHALLSSPSFSAESWSQKGRNKKFQKTSSSSSVFSSVSYDSESEESEVDDPEEEAASKLKDARDNDSERKELEMIKTEIETLKQQNAELQKLAEQNAALKAELCAKDEEKREVIRQLASSIDILKEENASLRASTKSSKNSIRIFDFQKLTKELFCGKVFTGQCKRQTTLVAL